MKIVFKILVVSFILLVGCTKDDVITEESIPEPEIPQNPYEWFGGYVVEDTTGFDRKIPIERIYFSEDTTLLYGRKHGKLWLGMFDPDTKEELNSWLCSKEDSIDIRYEYNSYKPMFKGFVLLLQKNTGEGIDVCPFFLNEKNEAFSLEEIKVHWGNERYFTIQQVDQNIVIYHSYYSGNIYTQQGRKIISSIEFSDDYHLGKEQYYISGFKEDKLWFAICEKGTISEEYITIGDYDRNLKFDLGYGEYKDVYLTSPKTRQVTITPWGYAFSLLIEPFGDMYDYSLYDFFICSNGTIYPINKGYMGVSIEIGNWYDNSVIIHHLWNPSDKYEVYSSKGELLYQVEKDSPMGIFHPVELMEPISFSESIYVDSKGEFGTYVRFLKCNLKKQDDYIFESYVGDLPKDSRVTVTLIDKKMTLWRYQFDIVNYDGSKKQFYVDLNIQTGEVIYI